MKMHSMKDPLLMSLGMLLVLLPGIFGAALGLGQPRATNALLRQIDQLARQVEPKVIAWRRDLHQHPELSNREFRTAQVVADHLRSLGLDVKTNVAHTGVVGVLLGRQQRPVVALRADMDALPVTEATGLPFAATVKTIYNGAEVGVMHACGHDAHMAMLMGVAEILTACRDRLSGSVKFIFQPAEEGAPEGETGGASLMIAEGVLENPPVDVIFGLHVFPFATGTINYRSGATMAAVDGLRILVHGQQTHGAMPWGGVDPIVVAAQIVLGLQQIISRQVNIIDAPAIISIGSIRGGLRSNIIPDQVELVGTIRTLSAEMRRDIHERIRRTATLIAQSAGATAEVEIQAGYPVVVNDPKLTQHLLPVLQQVVGENNVSAVSPKGTAEDFAYYQQRVPGLFFFLGVTPPGADPSTVAMNHSPYFYVDENALLIGVRCLAHLTVAYLQQPLR